MKLNKYWSILVIPLMAGVWIAVMALFKMSGIVEEKKNQKEQDIESVIQLNDSVIKLPNPKMKTNFSVEEALHRRRSKGNFSSEAVSANELSQILWAAYGVTDSTQLTGVSLKTVPSVGFEYPLKIYVAVGNVGAIEKGLYKYLPDKHSIELLKKGDSRKIIYETGVKETIILKAPVTLLYGYELEESNSQNLDYSINYAYVEAGHSAQNVYLQSTALDIGVSATTSIKQGGLETLNLPEKEAIIYTLSLGKLEK